jgi:hypothetical protein
MEFENQKLRSVAEAAARIMMGEKALHPNQQKLDVHEPEKDELTAQDFKKLRSMKKEETMHEESCKCGDCPSDKDVKKEEVDLDEGKMGQLSADLRDMSHDDFHKEYGKPKSHYDPSNFKKPVQPGKEMDRAKSLAQRAMASMKKEEVVVEASYKDTRGTLKDRLSGEVLNFHSMHDRIPSTSEFGRAVKSNPKQKQQAISHAKKLLGVQLKKEEVESLEEYKSTAGVYKHQGTYGTEKSIESGFTDYDKENELAKKHLSPKKPVKKGARQNRNFNTKLYKEGFSALISSYSENGMKGLFESLKKEDIIAEEPTNDEFNAQLDDAKKRAAGTKKQPEVAKAAVQAVQNEETHTTVEFIDYNDVNGVKYAEIDLAERKLTDAETEKKEDTVKSMKKNLAGFKDRYGDRAKEVMYATATKQAKGE